MCGVEVTHEFEADVRCLDPAVAQRVILKTEWLAEHPEALRFPLRHLPEDLKGVLAEKPFRPKQLATESRKSSTTRRV